jgi:hypothetical protein
MLDERKTFNRFHVFAGEALRAALPTINRSDDTLLSTFRKNIVNDEHVFPPRCDHEPKGFAAGSGGFAKEKLSAC